MIPPVVQGRRAQLVENLENGRAAMRVIEAQIAAIDETVAAYELGLPEIEPAPDLLRWRGAFASAPETEEEDDDWI